jgi:hypothetical protein
MLNNASIGFLFIIAAKIETAGDDWKIENHDMQGS